MNFDSRLIENEEREYKSNQTITYFQLMKDTIKIALCSEKDEKQKNGKNTETQIKREREIENKNKTKEFVC